MCTLYPYPTPGFGVIADLQVGEEIIITAGFGCPAKEEDAIDVVIAVSGFSALTASGVRLMCSDGHGIRKSGRVLEDSAYVISDAAMEILARVGELPEEEL